jgi:hypothetical protein
MSSGNSARCRIGAAWRYGLTSQIAASTQVDFLEVMFEDLPGPLPAPLRQAVSDGVEVIVHGATLSLGGADGVDERRLGELADVVGKVRAPLVSEHVAFVRSRRLDSGHLLPVARTADMLEVLVSNIGAVQDRLPVPLALENISAQFDWPEGEYSEAAFLAEVLELTGAGLLLDVSNLYGNSVNGHFSVSEYLDELPLDRIAYLHIGGGEIRDHVYHDTHAHPILPEALDVLSEVCSRLPSVSVLVERDDRFPGPEEYDAELSAVRAVCERSLVR